MRNSVPKVVTTGCLNDDAELKTTLEWISVFDKTLSAQNLLVTDAMELYLEPDQDEGCCRYYLIDHTTRAMFWLEEVETEGLGIASTVSPDHLRQSYHPFVQVKK